MLCWGKPGVLLLISQHWAPSFSPKLALSSSLGPSWPAKPFSRARFSKQETDLV